MKSIQTRALVEASLLVAIAAVIMISSEYVPFFILIGVYIWPIPITLLTFRHGFKLSMISMFVLLAIVASVINPFSALSMGLLFGIPSIVLGFCLKKRYSAFATIVAMSITTFVAFIVITQFSSLLVGIDILGDYFKNMEQANVQMIEMLRKFGFSEQQINEAMSKGFDINKMKMILPAIMAASSVWGSFFIYYLVGIIFKKLKININQLKPVDEWYIPKNLSYGLFFITTISWILSYMRVNNADIVLNSIFVLFMFTFMVNGFALAAWFLKSRGIAGKLRVFILVMILLTGLSQILFFVGLVDYFMDFRKLNPPRRRIPPEE